MAEIITEDDNVIIAKVAAATEVGEKINVEVIKTSNAGTEVIAKQEVSADDNGKVEASFEITDLPEGNEELVLQVYAGGELLLSKRAARVAQDKIVDVILVAGQSNALGQGGDAGLSIKPEEGTVYYQQMGDTTLSTSGNKGWDSALGKTWHDMTGHTVLIVKAAFGGTGFPSLPGTSPEWGSDAFGYWNPDNTATGSMNCYKMAKDRYATAIASIDTSKYTIGKCVYFWNQGENENGYYNAQQYYDAFMELHNAITTEFGVEGARPAFGGILPIRSNYADGFPNLELTGPRTAHYYMGGNENDIFLVTDANEHWSSDKNIADYFKSKYPDGNYPVSMPKAWADVVQSDNVHYRQQPMNEMGKEAAASMLAHLEQSKTTNGIRLVTPTGIEYYTNGDSIRLTEEGVIPIIDPAVGDRIASCTVVGSAASIDEFGVLTAQPAVDGEYAVLEVVTENGAERSFNVYSPISMISIASIKDNCDGAYTLSVDDGNSYTANFLDKELKANNMTASMVLVPGWIGVDETVMTWKEAQALVNCDDTVWSVVNHTMNHISNFQNCNDDALIESEINGSRTLLKEKFPNQSILSIVTPGGASSTKIMNKVKEQHLGFRTTGGGNMAIPNGMDGFYNIKCNPVGVYYNTNLTQMNGWIDNAIANGQWCVEMWHGVDDDQAGWGGNIAGSIAKSHIQYAAQKMNEGKLWVTTLDGMIAYTAQRLKAKVVFVSRDDDSISFRLESELTDLDYDTELTVNIALPQGWSNGEVYSDGKLVDSSVENGVLTVNVRVNSGEISVMKK